MALTPAFCSIVVVSFAGLGLATHCYTYGAGLFSKLQRLLHEMQCSKPAAVQAAAWEMRSRNYLNFCQYLVHFAAISMLWYAWDTVRNPSYSKSWLLMQFLAAWTQHHACLEGWIPLDCRSLRTISIAQYGAFATFNLGCLDNMQADAATALSFNTFQIVMRCLMALIFWHTSCHSRAILPFLDRDLYFSAVSRVWRGLFWFRSGSSHHFGKHLHDLRLIRVLDQFPNGGIAWIQGDSPQFSQDAPWSLWWRSCSGQWPARLWRARLLAASPHGVQLRQR